MNELSDDWSIRDHAKKHDQLSIQFVFGRRNDQVDYQGIWVRVHASRPGCSPKIEVGVSLQWIQDEWSSVSDPSLFDEPKHRPLQALHSMRKITRRPSTLSFICNEKFETFDEHEVSIELRSLVKGLESWNFGSTGDDHYIHALCEILWPPRPVSVTPNQDVFRKYGGYLELFLEARHPHDKMESWVSGGIEYSIMGGIYVHPAASSIIRHKEDNRMAGVMMDTTWTVMRLYVTAILVGISRNTAIPLAFSFGPSETAQLYRHFYQTFQRRYGISIGQFIVESDQGAALKAICKENQNAHRVCLRHFLARLKDPYFSVYIAELVRARTVGEFNMIRESYFKFLQSAIRGNPDLRQAAEREFRKAGLAFNDQEIFIADPQRWAEFSMLTRIDERIPPTTNSIESINGHLNEVTPRRNTFWGSMCRLASMIEKSIERYSDSVRHNYHFACQRSLRESQSMGQTELHAQSCFYNATIEHCSCGRTLHYTRMFEKEMPCPHQLYRGAVVPVWKTETKLIYERSETSLEIVVTITPRVTKLEDDARKEWLHTLAVDNIKHLSRTRKPKAAIFTWVAENWPTDIGEHFALGIPLSVLSLIAYGVNEFATQRRKSIDRHDDKGAAKMKYIKGGIKKGGEEVSMCERSEHGEQEAKPGSAPERDKCEFARIDSAFV
jgi:hypothetical protein